MRRSIPDAALLALSLGCLRPIFSARVSSPSPALAPSPVPAPAPGPRASDANPATNCNVDGFELFAAMAEKEVNKVMGQSPPPAEIRSKHVVLFMPSACFVADPALRLAAEAFASLPRRMKGGQSLTAFTKFVVVGHGEHSTEPVGISLGEDVCRGPGFSDKEAVHFLRTKVKRKLGAMGPRLLNCRLEPGTCPEPTSVTVEQPLPFLSAISNHSIVGKVVPVMMQTQSPELGVALGDALAMLTASGGAWEAERVLFVFGGDLSAGLAPEKAALCDQRTMDVVTGQGVPQVVKYFADLWAEKIMKGDCNLHSLPRSYASLLAAARVANSLGLKETRYKVASLLPDKDVVPPDEDAAEVFSVGFGTLLFWKDEGLPGEKLGAQEPPASLLAARARRTTALRAAGGG